MRRLVLGVACALFAFPASAQTVLSTDNAGGSGPTSKTMVRDASGVLYALSIVGTVGPPASNALTLFLSGDDGLTWIADPFVLNDATSGLSGTATTLTNHCSMAIDDAGTLHVLWSSYYYPSYYKQYYRQYVPSTSTASAIVDVGALNGATATARTAAMDIAVDGANTVWLTAQSTVTWQERLMGSTAPYASTLAFTNYGGISPSASAQTTRICVDALGTVHCSYYRNTGSGIYEHRAYVPGTGWTAATTIGNTTAPNDFHGALAADSAGNLHAVVAKDSASPATWQFVYRMRDVLGVWGPEVPVFSATSAQYTGIANYFVFALAVDETTGLVSVVHRDLAGGGGLVVKQKSAVSASFVDLPNALTPPQSGVHYYYMPTVRGSLYPVSNRTGPTLHLQWIERPAATPPFSSVVARHRSSTLDLLAPAVVGGSTTIAAHSGAETLQPYACGFALTPAPSIPLNDGRIVPLTLDFLLNLSLTPGNGLFTNTVANLDLAGDALIGLNVPNIPVLVGYPIYSCLAVADPFSVSGIGTISPLLTIVFQ
jgi:hypothetical protein